MFRRFGKRGQSVFEYTTLIVIVLATFLTISNYFKRGMQGRWKQVTDDMGGQYDPRAAVTNIVHKIDSSTNTYITTTRDNIRGGDWTERLDLTTSTETKQGNMTIGAY